jgi:hypothetical protein
MTTTQIYIAITIIVLATIAIIAYYAGKNKKKRKLKTLTPLASIAFAFIISGIIFTDNTTFSYSLLGVGVTIAIIDIIIKIRNR